MSIKYPYSKHKLNHLDLIASAKALKSGILSRGKFTQALEEQLCEITGARFAVAVSSGTAALHCAYLALDLPIGSNLISSPITFASALTTGVLSGLKPHFIDILENEPHLNQDLISSDFLNSNSVIVPTAMGGHSFNQQELAKKARHLQIPIIADHAHSLGGFIEHEKDVFPMANAEFSLMSTLSFQSTKAITGGGEGGAILTNSESLYKKLLAIRSQGMVYSDLENTNEGIHYHEMQFVGLNYRITEMQAALCLSQLKRLHEFIEKRNIIASWYFKILEDVDFITLPKISDPIPAWHLFAIRIKERNSVATKLLKKRIGSQVHYLPVYKHPWFRNKGFVPEKPLIQAENYYTETLSLPMYVGLKKRDVEFICDVLLKASKPN